MDGGRERGSNQHGNGDDDHEDQDDAGEGFRGDQAGAGNRLHGETRLYDSMLCGEEIPEGNRDAVN
jgi:hypothetical protein